MYFFFDDMAIRWREREKNDGRGQGNGGKGRRKGERMAVMAWLPPIERASLAFRFDRRSQVPLGELGPLTDILAQIRAK